MSSPVKPSEVLIEVGGLNLSIGGRQLLDNVSLTLHREEVLTIIGPNGSGKTTLLRIILGLLKPDGGTVSRPDGLRIGYMPQKLEVNEALPLSVGQFLGLARGASRASARDALAVVGLADYWNRPLKVLSGGETQRVLLARAIQGNPDILVLDEPVQAVDISGQAELYRLIADLRKKLHCGILMVSHDLHMVMAETDRVICLNGHVCCSGTPDVVRRDPSFVALFGDAAAALAVYAHDHDHTHDADGHVHVAGGGE